MAMDISTRDSDTQGDTWSNGPMYSFVFVIKKLMDYEDYSQVARFGTNMLNGAFNPEWSKIAYRIHYLEVCWWQIKKILDATEFVMKPFQKKKYADYYDRLESCKYIFEDCYQ